MLQIKANELRKKIDELAPNKNHDMIFDYLRTTGMIVNARDGYLNIDEECFEFLKNFVSEVENGDVVWVGNQGLLLVVDKHPKVNNDGHHFRALRVTSDETGYRILGELRSIIIDDTETFKIRHTSFDMAEVEKLSYERYTIYTRVSEINNLLANMKEQCNGN